MSQNGTEHRQHIYSIIKKIALKNDSLAMFKYQLVTKKRKSSQGPLGQHSAQHLRGNGHRKMSNKRLNVAVTIRQIHPVM